VNTYKVYARVPQFYGSHSSRRRQCTVQANSIEDAWETANTLRWYGRGVRIAVKEFKR
jgi:hypothetical protein